LVPKRTSRDRPIPASKLSALVDTEGCADSLRLTSAQVQNACEAEALIETFPNGAILGGDQG
jgi:hypothetical protein